MCLKNRRFRLIFLSLFLRLSACKSYQYSILNNYYEKKELRNKLIQNKKLLNASSEGDLKGVQEALKNGADINAVDYNGNSALMITKTKAIAEFLIDEKADIELTNKKGESAFILQAKTDNIEILKFLLRAGADPYKKTLHERTALMEASYSKRAIKVFLFLMHLDYDINAVSKFGDTALVIAILRNNHDKAKILLERGARTDIPNQAGWTAKTAAKYFKQTDLLQIIEAQKLNSLAFPCKNYFSKAVLN